MMQITENWFREQAAMLLKQSNINEQGDHALILASRQGFYELSRLLLSQGADPNCIDQYENNALWAACYADSESCCRLLVKWGCHIDYQNAAGNTALAYAASSGKDNMVRLLLEMGADPGIQNQDGLTALDLAASMACLKLLCTAGAM